jgi:hypothetical protein
MELFGIGILEVLLIALIALIFLGPQDTVKFGLNLGRAVRRFFSSEEWRTLLQASREIRTIPDKLLEETGLDHPEEFLPSEAEIRKEAGLDDLAQNMAEWNADLKEMKNTGLAPTEAQTGQIAPPQKEASSAVSRVDQAASQTGLEDLERDLSEWKADLSAWGNSKVIIPTPQASTPASDQALTVSEQAPASTASGQAPASAEPASPAQEQPKSEPPEQVPASTASEQAPVSAEPASPAQDQLKLEPPEQAPASTASEQAPASAEPASPAQEQPESEPPEQSPDSSSPPPEQEQK